MWMCTLLIEHFRYGDYENGVWKLGTGEDGGRGGVRDMLLYLYNLGTKGQISCT